MHVLVTGGCGYIGSALIPTLQATPAIDHVTVLDALTTGSPATLADTLGDTLSFYEGDVRDTAAVMSAMDPVDAVVHLAAITGAASTHDREAETHAINHGGTQTVLEAAQTHGVDHVVFASSCNVYGRGPSTDIDETTDPAPLNPYAESKLAAEQLLATATDIETTALRMSTVYGYAPGIRFNLVVNQFVFRALTDRPLTVYGDGTNWRPFIHVHDAARAFGHATCNPTAWSEPVYNVGASTENHRIAAVAETVSDVVGTTPEITYLEDEHPGPSYHVNFDRLADTGFTPEWSLRGGIEDLADRFTATQPAATHPSILPAHD